jgi:hypothetical protein
MSIESEIAAAVIPVANPATPYILLAKIVTVVAIAIGIYGSGYYVAARKGDAALAAKVVEDQKVVDKLKSDYSVAAATANGIAQGNSTVLQDNVNNIAGNLKQENQYAHKNPTANKPLVFHSKPAANVGVLNNQTASGQLVQHPADGVQGNSDPALTGGTGNQAQCRPDDATQQSLHAIAQDGDDAIRQLNALIDAYNSVRIVGCSITPASASELQTLLYDTSIDPTTVSTEESTPLLVVSKIKDGVLSIAPLLLPALIPGSAPFMPALNKALETPSPTSP